MTIIKPTHKILYVDQTCVQLLCSINVYNTCVLQIHVYDNVYNYRFQLTSETDSKILMMFVNRSLIFISIYMYCS